MNESNEYYKDLARAAAAYAHTGWFSKRWAILPSDEHVLVLCDNNPIAKGRDFWNWELNRGPGRAANRGPPGFLK
jgi:hypothetical protein